MTDCTEAVSASRGLRGRRGLCAAVLAATAFLAACQNTPAPNERFQASSVFGLYASPADAMAIASGQYGATPLVLVTQTEMAQSGSVLARNSGVAKIGLPDDKQGWVALDDLPHVLKDKALALPETQAPLRQPRS